MKGSELPQVNSVHVGIVLNQELSHLIVTVGTGIVERNETTAFCASICNRVSSSNAQNKWNANYSSLHTPYPWHGHQHHSVGDIPQC